MNTLFIVNTLTIVMSIVTVGLVLLNQPQTDSTFGSKDSFSRTRRGFESTVHKATIFSSIVLVLLVVLAQTLK
jgi:protein translocase SecG subunit